MLQTSGLVTVSIAIILGTASIHAQDSDRKPQYQADNITVPAAYEAEPTIPLSLEKAALHLDHGAVAWSKQKKCVSCHTNGTYLFIRPALSRSLGNPSDEMRVFSVEQLATLKETGARKLKRSGTRPAQVIYIAAGLAEWDAHVTKKLSPETDDALRLMLDMQGKDGTWHSLTCWPPFESSAYQEAHMAAMAVATAPGWLESVADDADVMSKVELLKSYLRKTETPHEYAGVLKLWTSLRLDGILSDDEQAAIVKSIRKQQQDDGGWSIRTFATPEQWGGGNRAGKIRAEPDFASPPSDGHMTGLALLVLQAAEISNDDPQLQLGLKWLRENQRESGRWWTRSLNTNTWHFITYSGTAYPVLALQNAGLEVSKKDRSPTR